MSDTTTTDDQQVADEWAAALEEAGDAGDTAAADAGEAVAEAEAADASAATFDNLQEDTAPKSDDEVNLEVVLDIPVTIAMEIRNLLQLNQGSVVELDRLAGEPMDVLVNGTLVAHGEVVVVNEKFGIRLTDVISPAERVKKLK